VVAGAVEAGAVTVFVTVTVFVVVAPPFRSLGRKWP
jgi:hypothetical protein